MTSFAIDDAPIPIPTGLNVNDVGALSFDPFGAGVGVGVALIAPVGVGVGLIELVGVAVGVGVGLELEVAPAEGPIFAMKPLEKPWLLAN